jgi:hypothetical protein
LFTYVRSKPLTDEVIIRIAFQLEKRCRNAVPGAAQDQIAEQPQAN